MITNTIYKDLYFKFPNEVTEFLNENKDNIKKVLGITSTDKSSPNDGYGYTMFFEEYTGETFQMPGGNKKLKKKSKKKKKSKTG